MSCNLLLSSPTTLSDLKKDVYWFSHDMSPSPIWRKQDVFEKGIFRLITVLQGVLYDTVLSAVSYM